MIALRLVLWSCTAVLDEPKAAPAPPPLFDTLGSYHRPISSRSREAQAYFDQGLRLVYAFNHEEAQAAFEEAARRDPSCAICFWGAALTLGPNINLPAIPERAQAAFALLKEAQALASRASPVERALIEALAKRYASTPPKEPEKQRALDAAYASAMRRVAKRYPADPDVNTLFAESLMDLRPWDFWTPDGKPQPGTLEIVATLERVLKAHPDHPGANHYFIHAVEASEHPERALTSAERLKTLVPGAGHLVHMPSHIYIRTGRYAEGSEANRRAIAADVVYNATHHARPLYVMYVAHNFQFLWATSMMEGRSAEALQAARDMLKSIPIEMFKEMEGYDFILAVPAQGLSRFGRWKEILVEQAPPRQYPTAVGLWRQARGLALVRTGDLAGAGQELEELQTLLQNTPAEAKVALNAARDVLAIAVGVLAAEIALAKGNVAAAVASFERAVTLEDALHYNEPPDWAYPVRHQLGAALLSAGRASQAESVYRADLERHPGNGWALFGLQKSLQAQGKTAEAQAVQQRFVEAWKRADVTLTASAF